MKKVVLIIVGILLACTLMLGLFSAGLVVGNLFFSDKVNIAETVEEIPIISDITDPEKPTEDPTTAPEEEASTTPAEGDVQLEIGQPAKNLEELFVPFWEAWDIVHEHYVDQPVDDDALMAGAIYGVLVAKEIPTDTLPIESPAVADFNSKSGTPEEFQELFEPFWGTWAISSSIDDEIVVQGAITGMLDALGDPHTAYMNPNDYEEATIVHKGEEQYEGIGAWVDISKDFLTIITPFPDSPAQKSGLQPGDKILAIDGEDLTGMDGELVRQKVLGPAGTTITMTIGREGMAPFEVDVTRASVTVPSVDGRMLDNDIAYLRLFLFGDKTPDEVEEALEALKKEKPIGLILDLRYNGGGAVDSAVKIASEFLDDEVIFYEVFGDGREEIYETKGRGLATEIPMVVIVNDGSASASEIVAGAIQDHDRAPLVGTTTFGKGSVQFWIPLSNNQGAVRVTIASWVTPERRLIHQIGLDPDYPIIGIPQTTIDDGYDINALDMDPDQIIILNEEDIQTGRDVQLEKAIEILLEQNAKELDKIGD